jgi:ribonuclease Z
MQSMTDQIDAVWKGPERNPQEADNSDPSSGASGLSHKTADARRSVAARDFMVVRVPSHELSPIEEEEGSKLAEEAGRVMQEWKAHGGVWLEDARVKRWVGVDAIPNGS